MSSHVGQYRDGVLGQLTGGNKVTKGGFYYGGAGYLMTKPLLHRLIGHDLSGPDPYGDRWGYHLYGLDRGSLYVIFLLPPISYAV